MTLRFLALLFSLFLASCTKPSSESTLKIIPHFLGDSINCQSDFLIKGHAWQYSQLQLYISELSVKHSSGTWQKLMLKPNAYQTNNIALIGESCSEQKQGANEGGNWSMVIGDDIDFLNVKAIKFNVGVPFEQNHLNPLTQESPLNISSMFWVWQTGHKFARIELVSKQQDWVFHLGSTGCAAASAMRAPSEPCKHPNIVEVELPVEGGLNSIVLDLAKLLKDVDLASNNGCQSGHDDIACLQLLTNIGLNEFKPNGLSSIFSLQ